jgi:hypothetical protein
MSSVFTKTVAVDWSGGVSTADLPSLAAIGVLATAGLMLSQASYRGAGLAAPLATLTVVNPVVAAVVGITMFGETFRYGTTGTALALSCGVVAAGGLILLTTERIQRTHAEPSAAAADPDGADLFVPAPAEAPADALVREGVLVEQIAALREELLVPAPALPDTTPTGTSSEELPDPGGEPPAYYGPFYGAAYIPMPVLDRQRTRVKS